MSPAQSGIVAVYQRHTYEKEMCEAIEIWERQVALLMQRHTQRKRVQSSVLSMENSSVESRLG